ncbi:unnamed protein product [Fusarium equiseti]|uniref:Uncharacterized protein n=1 Tax=Fusarium equiseti TaxID=61235 RepID=A0A8J2J3B4_FUSEQ|nr:unnamed protein product [Fusarium equiseti]
MPASGEHLGCMLATCFRQNLRTADRGYKALKQAPGDEQSRQEVSKISPAPIPAPQPVDPALSSPKNHLATTQRGPTERNYLFTEPCPFTGYPRGAPQAVTEFEAKTEIPNLSDSAKFMKSELGYTTSSGSSRSELSESPSTSYSVSTRPVDVTIQ